MNKYPLLIVDSLLGSTLIFNYKKEDISLHPIEYLNDLCIKHGSSLEGRKESFRILTNTKQKPAILISEKSELLYFPLKADSNFNNIYVNYSELMDFKRINKNETNLYFRNGLIYPVHFAYRTIKTQKDNCVAFVKQLHELY